MTEPTMGELLKAKNGNDMTLRDWFAGQASEGDVNAHRGYHFHEGVLVAKYTREQAKYSYADAMMAARNKKDKDE